MKVVIALLAAILTAAAVAVVSEAQTPQQQIKKLQGQLKSMRKEQNRLSDQLISARDARDTAKYDLSQARDTLKDVRAQLAAAPTLDTLQQTQGELVTRTAERDAAFATLGAAQQNGLAAVLTLTPAGLWEAMRQIWARMPNATCGYSRDFFSTTGYTSYSFTQFVC